jgi:hypothetical protein
MVGIGCRGRAGRLCGSIQYKVQGLHQLLQSRIQVLHGIRNGLAGALHQGQLLLQTLRFDAAQRGEMVERGHRRSLLREQLLQFCQRSAFAFIAAGGVALGRERTDVQANRCFGKPEGECRVVIVPVLRRRFLVLEIDLLIEQKELDRFGVVLEQDQVDVRMRAGDAGKDRAGQIGAEVGSGMVWKSFERVGTGGCHRDEREDDYGDIAV